MKKTNIYRYTFVYIYTDQATRWVIGSLGDRGGGSQPTSQSVAGPRSAEEEQEMQEDTNEIWFALVSNRFAFSGLLPSISRLGPLFPRA